MGCYHCLVGADNIWRTSGTIMKAIHPQRQGVGHTVWREDVLQVPFFGSLEQRSQESLPTTNSCTCEQGNEEGPRHWNKDAGVAHLCYVLWPLKAAEFAAVIDLSGTYVSMWVAFEFGCTVVPMRLLLFYGQLPKSYFLIESAMIIDCQSRPLIDFHSDLHRIDTPDHKVRNKSLPRPTAC